MFRFASALLVVTPAFAASYRYRHRHHRHPDVFGRPRSGRTRPTGAAAWTRLLEAGTPLLRREPDVYVSAVSRGLDAGPRDVVLLASAGELDLAPAFQDVASSPTRVRIGPIPPGRASSARSRSRCSSTSASSIRSIRAVWMFFYRLGGSRVSSQISVVKITDDDYKRFFERKSPLNPETLARLIERVSGARPAVIAIDLDTTDIDARQAGKLASATAKVAAIWAAVPRQPPREGPPAFCLEDFWGWLNRPLARAAHRGRGGARRNPA